MLAILYHNWTILYHFQGRSFLGITVLKSSLQPEYAIPVGSFQCTTKAFFKEFLGSLHSTWNTVATVVLRGISKRGSQLPGGPAVKGGGGGKLDPVNKFVGDGCPGERIIFEPFGKLLRLTLSRTEALGSWGLRFRFGSAPKAAPFSSCWTMHCFQQSLYGFLKSCTFRAIVCNWRHSL